MSIKGILPGQSGGISFLYPAAPAADQERRKDQEQKSKRI